MLLETAEETLGQVAVTGEVEGVDPRGKLEQLECVGSHRRYTQICDCRAGGSRGGTRWLLSPEPGGLRGANVLDLFVPCTLEVELDPAEAVLIRRPRLDTLLCLLTVNTDW